MLEIKIRASALGAGAKQNHLGRSWRLAGVLDTLPRPINVIPLPSSPEALLRARGLDSRGEISPTETGQRCGTSSPLSSAQAENFTLLPPSPVPSPAARLGHWMSVGPRCGVVAGARFSRAGERSAGGLLALRTMAVSESESFSARVLFVFWRGWSRGWAAT